MLATGNRALPTVSKTVRGTKRKRGSTSDRYLIKVACRHFLGLTPTPPCDEIIVAKFTPCFSHEEPPGHVVPLGTVLCKSRDLIRPTIPYCSSSNRRSTRLSNLWHLEHESFNDALALPTWLF